MFGIYSMRTLIHLTTSLMIVMFINSFITNSCFGTLFLSALIFGGIQYVRIPRLPESKISDRVLNLFTRDSDDPKRNLIFHKAGKNHAPENTLEAIEKAITLGVTSVEIDVDFTKDDVGVVIHGPRLDDTTDGTGFVSDFTFQELQCLNAAAKDVNRNQYPDVRIPALEACLEFCVRNNLVVFIDCKSKATQTAELISRLYKRLPELYDIGIVCSFYPNIIYAVRKADPDIMTALTHRNWYITTIENDIERHKELWKRLIAPFLDMLLAWGHQHLFWYICGNSFFLCGKDNISLDNKKFWSRLGVRLIAWTVNEPREREWMIQGLGIPTITDGL